jgi:hypothetical protein
MRGLLLTLAVLASTTFGGAGGSMAWAQEAAQDLQIVAEVASLERRSGDRTYSLREREAAADRSIELRRTLIESARDMDGRLPAWLTDQAAALLAQLGRDGADTAVLFALPTPAQREAVLAAAEEASRHLARMGRLRSASAGGHVDDDTLGVRARFFRGRAEALLAALHEGEAAAAHAEAGIAAIGTLALVNAGPEAVRRVSMGAALLRKRSPAALADVQLAIEELAWVAMGGDEGARTSSLPAATRAEAWLGLLHAAAALGNVDVGIDRLQQAMREPPFVMSGRADPLLAVLATDAITRVLVEQGIDRGESAHLERAVAAQMALLARQDLGFRAEALRPAALEKLANLSDLVPGDLALPAGMQLARAIRTARDPAMRAEAMAQLQSIADAGAATEHHDAQADAGIAGGQMFIADALWEWAVLLLQGGAADHREQLRAIEILTRLAREHQESPRATEAMVAALSYARMLVHPQAAAAYRTALTIATELYPQLPDIDLWRYERGRLAIESGDEGEMTGALAVVRQITAGSARSQVVHERLQGALLESIKQRLRQARQRHDGAEVVRIAASELEPEARRAVAWAQRVRPAVAAGFEADRADALIEAGRVEARGIYQQLLMDGRDKAISGGRPRLMLGLARGHLIAGDARAAFALLREVAAALDAAPISGQEEGPARREEFWHAWMLMLHVLHQEAAEAPEKRGVIRAHIRRLESIDTELGGEPWRMRIRQVRDAVSG